MRSTGEVVALVYDSLVDGADTPADHVLRFEDERFHFDVSVSIRPSEVFLSGNASPVVDGRFELDIDQKEPSLVQDNSDGFFFFGPVGHGVVRLSFCPSDGPKVQTDWFRI